MQQKKNLVQKLAVLYLIVWTIAPPLGIDMKYRLLALGCAGVWALIAIRRGFFVEKIHIYAILFVIAVAVVAYLEKGSLDGILQQIAIYILVVCFLINAFYKEGRWQELSGIVPIVLVLLIIFNYKSAQCVIEDPSIARLIVRADEATYEYMRQGIGGYGLLYPQVCIFPAILAWTKSAFRKNKLCFIIGCVWVYTFIYYLVNAGYSIAIFASIVGAIMLFLYKGKNAGVAMLISVVILLGFMGALFYLDGFREMLLEFFDGTEVANKINDLVSTSETGVTEDSIYARQKAYMASINVMLDYPFIGSLWNASGGGHSAILDSFAKYGILGGYVYVRMIFYVPNDYKMKISNPKIYRISNAVIVSILLVALLDTFPFNFMGMILLVLPLLYEDIIKWEGIKQ